MRVVVVGAGISGLTAARRVLDARPDVDVEVLEAGPVAGGVLRRADVGGVVLDVGAESLLARRPEAVDLVRAAGLGADLVHPATARAAVRARGASHPLPAGTVMGVPGSGDQVEHLLGAAAAARVRAEEDLPAEPLTGDVSVARYVGDRVGRAVVDGLVEPLLGGVYAGHADRLSLQATVPALWEHARRGGSLLAAVRAATTARPAGGPAGPVFAGVRGGVARLPEALAAGLGERLRLAAPVTGLNRADDGWRVHHAGGTSRADAVVLAVPAPVAARLLAGVAAVAAAELARVETASMVIAALAVPAAELAGLTGSGVLVPPVAAAAEGLRVKALTLSALKWDWVREASAGTAVLRVSLGRAGEREALDADDADVLRWARADASRLLGRDLHPVDARVVRWRDGLPQYAVGHRALVERLRADVARLPGLALAGSVLDGVGVPACVAAATRAAAEVLATLPAVPAAGAAGRMRP